MADEKYRRRPRTGKCSVKGCVAPDLARGLCELHYARWRRHGATDDIGWSGRPVDERLWGRATRLPGGCLFFPVHRGHFYGELQWEGETWSAHRLAWRLVHGPIPEGLEVCHHCDNPPCIEVDHLFLGTAKENHLDAARKGRKASRKNGRSTRAKLTVADVDNMVAAWVGRVDQVRAWAAAFGVCEATIYKAVASARAAEYGR